MRLPRGGISYAAATWRDLICGCHVAQMRPTRRPVLSRKTRALMEGNKNTASMPAEPVCGAIVPRSCRDHAEIAPRSRRDRAEIALR